MKFYHMRLHDVVENLDPSPLPNGGLTLAYEVKDNIVYFAMAKCNENDNFCRRIGRDIAQGRYLAGQVDMIALIKDEPVRAALYRAVHAHYRDLHLPEVQYYLW